jgi:hypothetical protein
VTSPKTEPAALFTGDTWNWTRTLADYPASAGWILKYVLASSATRINIAGTADGDDHAISVAAATTAAYVAGTYVWQAFVEKGAERHTVGRGSIKLNKGLIDGATTGDDLRSDAQIALDAARAALKTYTETNGTVSQYEVNTGNGFRKVIYRDQQQLVQLVNYWAGEVKKEIDAEKRRQGKALAGRIVTRFGR